MTLRERVKKILSNYPTLVSPDGLANEIVVATEQAVLDERARCLAVIDGARALVEVPLPPVAPEPPAPQAPATTGRHLPGCQWTACQGCAP